MRITSKGQVTIPQAIREQTGMLLVNHTLTALAIGARA